MARRAVAEIVPIGPPRITGNALQGTIDEKIRAYDQIAANLASLQLNGWNDVQKVKAGCWMADGAGMHPAVFMQNHYVMVIKGRLTVEPKVDFVLGVLQARIPSFRFKVIHETDDACKVTMSDGVNEHTVEYTVEDAKRQGLFSKPGDNAWTTGNTREMCYKQAVKRCGKRIGAAALLDLPVTVDDLELEPARHEPSVAELLDEATGQPSVGAGSGPAVEAGGAAGGAAPPPTPATPPAKSDAVKRLSAAIVKKWGKMPAPKALEKAALVYNHMQREQTGVDPRQVFKSPAEIGAVDAERMIEYVAKMPDVPSAAAPASEPPPAETADEAPPPEPETISDGPEEVMEKFKAAVARAKKVLGRKFYVEAPPGSGTMYYIDQATFSKIGLAASVKIEEDGAIMASDQTIASLTRLMIEACDEKERGR